MKFVVTKNSVVSVDQNGNQGEGYVFDAEPETIQNLIRSGSVVPFTEGESESEESEPSPADAPAKPKRKRKVSGKEVETPAKEGKIGDDGEVPELK